MDNKPDYDAMFADSQKNPFAKPDAEKNQYDEMYRQSMQKKQYKKPETTEEKEAPYLRMKQPSSYSPEYLGFVSLIIGVAAFILIFIGMFLHFFMWLNIVICLTGIGFGIAALLKKTASRVLGIIGIILCVFDLLVQLICMIVVALGSGISAIFRAFT